jgi:Ca-activated chloride channel family protein
MNTRTFRLIAILGIFFLVTAACDLEIGGTSTPTAVPAADPNALTIAASPEMAPLLGKLADQFNSASQGKTGPLGIPVKIITASPSDMVAAALKPDPIFQAMSPDSSIWLSKLSNEWGAAFANETAGPEALPIPRQRYSLPQRYAVSPVVIAMWEKIAQGMGWPAKPIGWNTLQERASQDANFHWNHPSTSYAAGLLATLAEFYAGAGINRGLTEALATSDSTLAYVKKVEGTVRFYGEGESAVLDRLKKDGTSLLDAFVAQEQIVLRWNSENPGQKLVAIYPVEGTLWADHPLALLERYADFDHSPLTNPQRDTFYEFSRYLFGDDIQKQILAGGFRPVNLGIDLQGNGSPFKSNPSVDALQPKTTLQLPPYPVIQVIEDYRAYIKKPTNVMLVVDTSGSMADASKLPRVQTALLSFIDNIKGQKDRLGLIDFSDHIKYNSSLLPVNPANKDTLTHWVSKMSADGNTAVLDSVLDAFNDLQKLGDSQAINAIVVMTDGRENSSTRTNLSKLQNTLTNAKVPVVVFSIAFGKDADVTIMKGLAQVTKGQFRQAESFNIEELYQLISTYF